MTALQRRVAARETVARSMGACYWMNHPDSPIADAAGSAGCVRITERMRPEIEHVVSTHDLRVAYGLGIISTTQGSDVDVHQHESGLWPDVGEDEYLVNWITTGVEWHRRGGDGGIAGELARIAQRTEDDEMDDELAQMVAAGYGESDDVVVADVLEVIDDGPTVAPMCLPQPMLDYLCRLVHVPKANYAADCAMAVALGDPMPASDAKWAEGVRDKVSKYMRPTGRPTNARTR